MYKLGITGGIGSGKTTASDFFKEKGASIFNADKEAKRHLKSTVILQHKIIECFGKEVTSNNKLSIKKLAEVGFQSKLNQEILNGIMWPEVYLLIDTAIRESEKEDIDLFVLDAAMMFEANLVNMFDSTLLITANKSIRISRALKRKNLHLEQIQNRMSLQIPESQKKKKAGDTITNNGNIDQLYQKLERYYNTLPI